MTHRYDPYTAGYRAGAHGGFGFLPMFMTDIQAGEWMSGFMAAAVDLAFYGCKPRLETIERLRAEPPVAGFLRTVEGIGLGGER